MDRPDDLIARLRTLSFDVKHDEDSALANEAADEIERLRADRERLDWLEENANPSIDFFDANEQPAYIKWAHAARGVTLRAAIDAVRAASPEDPESGQTPN